MDPNVAEKKEGAKQQRETEAENDAASASSSADESVFNDDADFHFADDAAAEAVRTEGLACYNAGDYEGALDKQYRVVRYFADAYGAPSAKSAIYFLDYALSQLRVLQSQSTVEDTLKPRDEETMESCFVNLECARVGIQRREDELEGGSANPEYAKMEMLLAETHNALAQLFIEQGDSDRALREYEAELLIYRSLQADEVEEAQTRETMSAAEAAPCSSPSTTSSVVPAGRVVAALYGIADCFLKECDFTGAEERLRATLDEVAKYPPGTIAAELVAELNDLLEDACEMKDGKYEALRKEIDHQFVVEAADKVPTAQEFYDEDGNCGSRSGRADAKGPTVMGANGEEQRNPYVSAVPGGGGHGARESSHLSMPLSATGAVLGFSNGVDHGNENSNSVSVFPTQQLSRSGPPTSSGASGPAVVTTVVARKKAKVPMGSPSASNSAPPVEPELKRSRAE